MSEPRTRGLHHVTAISGDAQATVEFYVGALGLRMVKKSVNQDDPGIYHLFFADGEGHPGTDLTFFPFDGVAPGREGAGQVIRVSFRVPAGSLGWWRSRLEDAGAPVSEPATRFGEEVLPLRDPDGLGLELVAVDDPDPALQWTGAGVPGEVAIAGFHAVTLLEDDPDPARRVLEAVLGLEEEASEDGATRFRADPSAPGSAVDVRAASGRPPGRQGSGTVHHIAFRAADPEEQQAFRTRVIDAGLRPTPVIDRFWFESVYFREPGGVLFEIATDGPGFAVDEDPDELGTHLVLPPWLEERREAIEERLPALSVPDPKPTRTGSAER